MSQVASFRVGVISAARYRRDSGAVGGIGRSSRRQKSRSHSKDGQWHLNALLKINKKVVNSDAECDPWNREFTSTGIRVLHNPFSNTRYGDDMDPFKISSGVASDSHSHCDYKHVMDHDDMGLHLGTQRLNVSCRQEEQKSC
jgi:hypothetical protein